MHTHDELRFAARVAATPLPPQDHPEFDTLLRAKAQAEIKRRETREAALEDLYTFSTSVLGYSDFYEPLHRPLCEFTQRPEETLTLIPRGCFKSTVSSVSYPLWLLFKYPDTRILLCNAGLTNPRKWIKEMKDHLTTNAVVRWVFPDSCPTFDEVQQFGFTESFTVPNRTPGCPWGEASVEISSRRNHSRSATGGD